MGSYRKNWDPGEAEVLPEGKSRGRIRNWVERLELSGDARGFTAGAKEVVGK